MNNILVTLGLIIVSNNMFAQLNKQQLYSYYAIKDALVESDFEVSSAAIVNFINEMKSIQTAEFNSIKKSVDKIAKAVNIDQQRLAFNDLSESFWKLVKSSKFIEEPVYLQYCPMKKAYWLSNEQVIKNPYYGEMMLTCGKVVETENGKK